MNNKIYGRKVGAKVDMALLVESADVSTCDKKVGLGMTDAVAIVGARRMVQALRDRNIEGYIVFESDPTHYDFTPGQDFGYPGTIH